jgi:adenylylsulfate kinase
VSAPYEAPENPVLVLHTDRETLEESVQRLVTHLEKTGLLQEAAH